MISPDKSKIIWEGEKDKEISFNLWDHKTNSHSVQQCTPFVIRNNQYKEAFAKAMYPELVTGDESSRVKHLIKSEFGIYDTIEDVDIPELAYRVGVPEHVLQNVVDYYESKPVEKVNEHKSSSDISLDSILTGLMTRKFRYPVLSSHTGKTQYDYPGGKILRVEQDLTFDEILVDANREAIELCKHNHDIQGDEPLIVQILFGYHCAVTVGIRDATIPPRFRHNNGVPLTEEQLSAPPLINDMNRAYKAFCNLCTLPFNNSEYQRMLQIRNEAKKDDFTYNVNGTCKLDRTLGNHESPTVSLNIPQAYDESTDLIKETVDMHSINQEIFKDITKIIAKDTDKKMEEYIAQKNQSNDKTADLEKDTDCLSQDLQDAIDKGLSTDYAKKLMKCIAQIKFSDKSKEPDFEYEEGVYSREIFRIYNGDAEHPKLIKQVYGIPKKDMWNE